jgi:DNA polymerase-3 subunit epsilon
MKLLFIDTETNGLPKNRFAPYTSHELWPNILQISWQLVDSLTWRVLSEYDAFIKLREPWNKDAERIHQIPEGIVKNFGKEPGFVLGELKIALSECDFVISHNMMFDKTVILSEVQRLKESGSDLNPRDFWRQGINELCTMNTTREFCGIKFPNSNDYKYPKLNELYAKLFNKQYDISGASLHNSKHDVSCLVLCVKKMVGMLEFAKLIQ